MVQCKAGGRQGWNKKISTFVNQTNSELVVKDPDLGDGAGIETYSWDNRNLYTTNITYSCPFGQAFDGEYTRELKNTCNYRTVNDTQVTWKYNADYPLPNCIRKYHQPSPAQPSKM